MAETTIGELLRRHRKVADLTQQFIATQIPCNSGTVSRIENGDLFPQMDYLQAFASIKELSLTQDQRLELSRVYMVESRSLLRSDSANTGGIPNVQSNFNPNLSLSVEQTDQERQLLTQHYRRFIIDSYSQLNFHGMGIHEQISALPLNDIYVPLRAHVKLPRAETWLRVVPNPSRAIPADQLRFGGRPLSGIEVEIVGDQLSTPIAVLDLLRDQDGLVILGDPGSGKSTFVKWLAVNLAEMASNPNVDRLGLGDRIPIVIPVRAYAMALATRDIALVDFFMEYYRSHLDSHLRLDDVFGMALMEGRAIIMLDGLDEVSDLGMRMTVVDRVRKCFNWFRRAGNKFVLTSRLVGFRDAPLEAPGLLQCTLSDFNSNDIEDFARRWYEAVSQHAPYESGRMVEVARRREIDLLADIGRHTRVRELAANPLLLTIMTLMKRQGVELVERRVELFDNYVRTLLKYWNLARSIDQRAVRVIDNREAERVLAQLALWIQQTNPERGLVGQMQAHNKLIEIFAQRGTLDPEDAAQRLLQDARDYSGLLVEIGPGNYGFVHLTFLEYLAASAIAQLAQTNLDTAVATLAPHLLEPAWREVVLLTISCLGIIRRADDLASAFIERLLQLPTDRPGQVSELLGEAAADAWPGGISPACHLHIRQTLLDTMLATEHVPAPVRIAAGNALGRLDDPRPSVLSAAEMPFCLVAGGPFDMGGDEGNEYERDDAIHINTSLSHNIWVSQFPVSNAQFQEFIEAGGYANEAYWDEAKAHGLWRDGQVLQGSYRWDNDAHEFVRSIQEWANHPRQYLAPFTHANHPSNNITWYEALAYTRWLTDRFDLRRLGWQAQIPSEAEWEKAARGGHEKQGWQLQWDTNRVITPSNNGWTIVPLREMGLAVAKDTASAQTVSTPTLPQNPRRFPWGGVFDANRCNAGATAVRTTSAVGCFANGASPYGCQDMIGNVWEWTRSLWGYKNYTKLFSYPYAPNDGREDLTAPPHLLRTVRGGSWVSMELHARCAYRRRNAADYLNENVGFRVVLTPC